MEDIEDIMEQKMYDLRQIWRKAYDIAKEFYDKETLIHAENVEDRVSKMNPHWNKSYGYDYEPTDIDLFWSKAVIAALLHDIIEDTACTADILMERGIPKDIVSAVMTLTRPTEKHDYFDDYIVTISKNELSRVVKIADLEHNMDIRRLEKFGDYEQKRLVKYWYSWKFLKREISETEAHNTLHPDQKYR